MAGSQYAADNQDDDAHDDHGDKKVQSNEGNG